MPRGANSSPYAPALLAPPGHSYANKSIQGQQRQTYSLKRSFARVIVSLVAPRVLSSGYVLFLAEALAEVLRRWRGNVMRTAVRKSWTRTLLTMTCLLPIGNFSGSLYELTFCSIVNLSSSLFECAFFMFMAFSILQAIAFLGSTRFSTQEGAC